MSIEALRWALEKGMEAKLEPTLRYVLLILGNRADEHGFLFPSVAWIVERTGLSRRTVQTHLQTLEKLSLLNRDQRQKDDGGRTSDAMQLPIDQPGLFIHSPGATIARGGAVAARGGRNGGGEGGAVAAPYTQEDTQDQKKKAPPQKGGKVKTRLYWQMSDSELLAECASRKLATRGLTREALIRNLEGKLQ